MSDGSHPWLRTPRRVSHGRLGRTGFGSGPERVESAGETRGVMAADVVPFWLAGRRATGEEVSKSAIPTTGAWSPVWRRRRRSRSRRRRRRSCGRGAFSELPAHVRADALDSVSRGLAADAEGVARTITAESGKPIRWARVEVERAVANFRTAADEARRFSGEVIRLDSEAIGEGRLALVRRFPLGPVFGVTPFNFPSTLSRTRLRRRSPSVRRSSSTGVADTADGAADRRARRGDRAARRRHQRAAGLTGSAARLARARSAGCQCSRTRGPRSAGA